MLVVFAGATIGIFDLKSIFIKAGGDLPIRLFDNFRRYFSKTAVLNYRHTLLAGTKMLELQVFTY
jgi:hypothetical protein